VATTTGGGDLIVFAASSLTKAFEAIGTAFEAEHPGTTVRFNFAASSALAAQINQGAPADVFASADQANMSKLTSGTLATPTVFATNTLEIIVGAGNPKHIASLADLARRGVSFVTAAPEVPIGKYAAQVLAAADVNVTPVSLEADAKSIVTKVTLGEADAGIVYVTDVLAAGAKATGVAIPAADNVVATYPIAVPSGAEHAALAAAFEAYVESPAGQAILAKFGFSAP
jgi:molybdate transport system substrate-binding protein